MKQLIILVGAITIGALVPGEVTLKVLAYQAMMIAFGLAWQASSYKL